MFREWRAQNDQNIINFQHLQHELETQFEDTWTTTKKAQQSKLCWKVVLDLLRMYLQYSILKVHQHSVFIVFLIYEVLHLASALKNH
jgi:hypothetical protein